MGFEYEVLGLTAALRVKGHMLALAVVGEGGLGGRVVRDRKADMAVVYCVLVGVVGGEK